MTDRLQRGNTRLQARMLDKAVQTVTYKRGNTELTGISAVIGETPFRISDVEGFQTRVISQDFLIAVSDLSSLGDPEAGDKIIETAADGTIREFEVAAPGGEPEWRWSDTYRTTYRIHTKYIKEL